MDDAPHTTLTRTTTELLENLRNPANADAWSGFDARYRPVLLAFARGLGFSADDAAELAQQTLAGFSRSYAEGRYQRGQGRLSSWLIGIARHVGQEMRRPRGAARVGGDTMLGEMPDEQALSQVWSREREQIIFAEAMAILRSTTRTEEVTIRAFELVALRGVPAAEVAAQCGMTVETVYVVKNRLTRRLREIVSEITAAYDEGE